MAGAAAQAAAAAVSGGLRSVASAGLESHVKALAVSKTKEVTGIGQGGLWTPRMTRIALSGIEAWDEKWKELFPGADNTAAAATAAAATGAGAAGERSGLVKEEEEPPGHDPPAREGSEDEEGVVAANASPAAPTTAAMRPGVLAGKAVADTGGGGVGDAAPLSGAPAKFAPGIDELPPGTDDELSPSEVARELALGASASKPFR